MILFIVHSDVTTEQGTCVHLKIAHLLVCWSSLKFNMKSQRSSTTRRQISILDRRVSHYNGQIVILLTPVPLLPFYVDKSS